MYKIELSWDDHDCETCGGDYAHGYKIYKNNVLVVDKSPYAYCWGSRSYDQQDAYKDICNLENIQVEITGEE